MRLLPFMLALCLTAHAAERPNIVLILADDLGWSDLGCYGSDLFETPHLDKFASEGVRYTQAYAAAPICSASRAAILTGKSTAELHFEFVTKNKPGYQPMETPFRAPPYTLDLPLEEVIIPEMLDDYETAFFGKWHVSRHYKDYLGWSPTHGPKAQGFDIAEEDFGSHPYSYWKQKEMRSFTEPPTATIPPDSMTERAIAYLDKPHEKPFFLMVSHFYVHTPVHTRVEMLHSHYMEKIPRDHPRRDALAHYGAMVTTLDHHVGQLLDSIDHENTLVVFTSDNGGHPEYGGNAPLRGSKWNLYEGGVRVPMIARWPGELSAGTIQDTPVIGTDLFSTFATVSGSTSSENSLPKATPTILPSGSENQSANREFIWHFPYYHPETGYHKAPDSINIDDGYTSKTHPQSAIRSGNWKLITYYDEKAPELYNLKDDPSETTNLADTQPETVKRLSETLSGSLIEAEARFPERNPDIASP